MPTKRNTDILSNKEMFVKYASIVEFVRDCNIRIIHAGKQNKVVLDSTDENGFNKFTIYSATPNVAGIEKLIGIVHELAHVLFQSPFTATNKLIKMWDATSKMNGVYFNMFNVLEDQRIESHMGKMYLKHGHRFLKTREKLGMLMGMDLKYKHPVSLMLGIRFMRGEDLAKRSEYYPAFKEALDKVEFTDKFGALRVLVSIKPIIDKMFNEREEEQKELEERRARHGTDDPNDSESLTVEESRGLQVSHREDQENNLLNQDNQQRSNGENEEVPEELEDITKLTQEDVDNMIADSREEGDGAVEEVYDKLRGNNEVDKRPAGVVYVKRPDEKVTIDYNISKGMIRTFKHLMMKNKEFIDHEGEDIDVESYVEGIIRGSDMGNCRINKKTTHGASIVVSIDGSGSMSWNNKIDIARNLVATMYDSIKNLPNIELRANVWSGDSKGEMGITEINNKHEVKNISLTNKYYSTPTHMAFEYSARMLKEMNGSKKLLIIVTDGQPAYSKGGYRISDPNYLKMCRKSLLKAKCVTTNIMCIIVGGGGINRRNRDMMGSLFKPSALMRVPTMENASETVIKRFKQMVIKSLV
jgi:hypothetical protein